MFRSIFLAAVLVVLTGCEPATVFEEPPLAEEPVDASVETPADGGCVATTCEELGAECGEVDDGCGQMLACGSCQAPMVCGESGPPNRCSCPFETDEEVCARLGITCGLAEVLDLCGAPRVIDPCGDCEPPLTCGGGGIAGTCGQTTCSQEDDAAFCLRLGKACGPATGTDLCGAARTVDSCGTCATSSSCNASGKCEACTPTTCAAQGANCGSIPNGCGKMIPCGSCAAPRSCGGGGVANVCGCTPTTCAAQGATCGQLADGCGGTLDCGSSCAGDQSCVQNRCVARGGLRVEGNKLLRNNLPFYPRGFNMIGLLTPDACTGAPGAGVQARNAFGRNELLQARDQWAANTLRFQVSQRGMDPQDSLHTQAYVDRVKNGVALARSLGFVVIVSMQDQSISCGTAHPLPSAATLRAWSFAAPLFKDDPEIMFEVFNEPQSQTDAASWTQWKSGGTSPLDNQGVAAVGHQQLVNHLRSLGAKNVLIADGANFAGKLQGLPLLADTLAVPQLMYAIHPYYFHIADNATLATDSANWETRFGYLTPQKPIIVTEWNSKGADGTCKLGQEQRIHEFLKWLQDRNIGILAHAFDVTNTMVKDLTTWTPTAFTGCVAGSDAGQIIQDLFRSLASAQTPACGDGQCDTGESCTSCPGDCCTTQQRAGCIQGSFSVFYGNLHAHTGYSDGGPDPDPANLQAPASTAFTAARNGGYHITILTDHMNNHSHYTNPDNSMLPKEYEACRQAGAAKTQAGAFLADCGFEVQVNSAPGGGHANVFYSDALFPVNPTSTSGDIVRNPSGASLVTSFYNYLIACPGCIGQFNHPGGSNWSSLALDSRAVGQMKMFEFNGGSSTRFNLYIDALRKGWRVAPNWSGDNHQQNWGALDVATGLFMSSLDMAPMKQAISDRRTTAVRSRRSRESIKLMADSVCWMGSILKGLGSTTLHVEATTDATAFASIELYATKGTGYAPIATYNCAGVKRCVHDFPVDVTAPGAYFAVAKRDSIYQAVSAPIWFEQ